MYDKLVDEAKMKLIKAPYVQDLDLAQHLKELNKKKLVKGEWKIFPKIDISEGCDYT